MTYDFEFFTRIAVYFRETYKKMSHCPIRSMEGGGVLKEIAKKKEGCEQTRKASKYNF